MTMKPLCEACNDTGMLHIRTAVDEYEMYECDQCPPPLQRMPVPRPIPQAPRLIEQLWGNDDLLTVADLTSRLSTYLDMKRSNTWPPEQFSVADADRREDAIDWFVDVCIKLGIVDVSANDPRRVIP